MITNIWLYDIGEIPYDLYYDPSLYMVSSDYQFSDIVSNPDKILKELCHFSINEGSYIIADLSGFGFELNKSEINSRILTLDYSTVIPPKKISIGGYINITTSQVKEKREELNSNTKTQSKVLLLVRVSDNCDIYVGNNKKNYLDFFIFGYIEESITSLHSDNTSFKITIACDTPYFMYGDNIKNRIQEYIDSDAPTYSELTQIYMFLCEKYINIKNAQGDPIVLDFSKSGSLPLSTDGIPLLCSTKNYFTTNSKFYTL